MPRINAIGAGKNNTLMEGHPNGGVYFNCSNPLRWVNIKITDYPIQPQKKNGSQKKGNGKSSNISLM